MNQYFPKPYEPFIEDTNVKDNLSNYATKTYLKIYLIMQQKHLKMYHMLMSAALR